VVLEFSSVCFSRPDPLSCTGFSLVNNKVRVIKIEGKYKKSGTLEESLTKCMYICFVKM